MPFSEFEEQDSPRITPAVQWLIAINVAVYFLQLTLVGPVDIQRALAFEVRDLTERPWTIVTYMFVHAGFWHLAVNMWMLWLFGPRLERALDSVAAPVLLVRGQRSDLVTDEYLDQFGRRHPSVEIAEVGGARHMVAGDVNDSFTSAVIDFLSRARSRG